MRDVGFGPIFITSREGRMPKTAVLIEICPNFHFKLIY